MALSPSDLSAATDAILSHKRLLVIPHANVDPDGLSSALACYQLFTALGKDVTVICPDTPPESLQFLPGFERLTQHIEGSQNFIITVNLDEGVEVETLRYTVENRKVNIVVVPKKGAIRGRTIAFHEGEAAYDLIVAVDTADTALFGSLYAENVDLFSSIPILNIDHHVSNVRYGQIHMIDPTAASATEVLYHWFTQVPDWRERITPDIATLLLTGLITDTRSFQNPNTTPRSLEIAAELLERGARQQEIIQHIYKTKPLSTLKIWGRALNRIQVDPTAGIVWSVISREDLQEMGSSSRETHGILDELISTIPEGQVHVLFTELEEGGLKASMRSSSAIDCSRLAAETFGGGGHPRAAGFRVKQYSNFQLQVLECVQKLREGMEKQRQLALEKEEGSTPLTKIESKPTKPTAKNGSSAKAPPPAAPSKDILKGIAGPSPTPTKERDVLDDLTKKNP
jgi:phosphoesterase RecJ-like protein